MKEEFKEFEESKEFKEFKEGRFGSRDRWRRTSLWFLRDTISYKNPFLNSWNSLNSSNSSVC
jgi:hypothetical protein